jgi:hypothetical protein
MNTNRLSAKMLFKTGLLLVVFLATTGCGPGQFLGPTITPIPTDTPAPTATSSPTPTQPPTITPTVTDRPTQVPDQVIFSDSFDDNSNQWELANFTKIEDGLMKVSSGDHELAAIKIPLDATPNDVAVQVDIIPNPPAGADPTMFLYGAGCRLGETGNDFYFFGLSPAPGVDGFFMAVFMQFQGGKLVDYDENVIQLPEAQEGDGYAATFLCSEDSFQILNGRSVAAAVTNSDFREGDLFLGLYRLDDIAGSVSFDNLTVSEVH